MTDRNNCAALILSHGRPDNVATWKNLRRSGWTRPIYIVCDDQDRSINKYIENFGNENVIVFDKQAVADRTDTGDQGQDLRSVLFARNAAWDIAKNLGLDYYFELDDDYHDFRYRHDNDNGLTLIRSMDRVADAMIEYLDVTGAKAIAMSQGGDHFGGYTGTSFIMGIKRKAMNTFMLRTDRPFDWLGLLNDDVNTYTVHGNRGDLFMTIMSLQIQQTRTQESAGGLTDLYLDFGTYTKSFYTVMMAPSCTSVTSMGVTDRRMHHRTSWDNAVPKIISDTWKKTPTR